MKKKKKRKNNFKKYFIKNDFMLLKTIIKPVAMI